MALFLLCALPVGMNFALSTPPGQVPDEPAHMARAAGLLRGEILIVRKNDNGNARAGVKIEGALLGASIGATTPIGDRAHVLTEADDSVNKAKAWDHATIIADIPNTATYFPIFYVPASIGLIVGKLCHFSPYECLLTARLFMLAAFLALGCLTLWLTKTGEAWLFAILTLPMTLFLSSSLSADGLLIATACLSAALLTRGSLIWSAVLLGLIGAAKIPYAAMLALILLPLGADFKKRLKIAVLAGLPVLLWSGLVYLCSAVPFVKPPYHPGALWTGDPGIRFDHTNPSANLRILLSNPKLFFSLPYDYVLSNGRNAINEGIGILGMLGLVFSDGYYAVWKKILLLSLVGQIFAITSGPASERSNWTWLNAAYVLVILLLDAWAIAIALYLNWTDVGTPHIDGLQGRYFLPLLPFLLLAVPELPVLRRIPQPLLLAPVLLLGLFDIAFLPQQIARFFYLH